jgi:hypothetical protein
MTSAIVGVLQGVFRRDHRSTVHCRHTVSRAGAQLPVAILLTRWQYVMMVFERVERGSSSRRCFHMSGVRVVHQFAVAQVAALPSADVNAPPHRLLPLPALHLHAHRRSPRWSVGYTDAIFPIKQRYQEHQPGNIRSKSISRSSVTFLLLSSNFSLMAACCIMTKISRITVS